jgi:glycogen(starch) synthase
VKICIVSYGGYPTLSGYGGIALYSQVAARALAARGHEVHVIATYAPEYQDTDGFHKDVCYEARDGNIQLHARSLYPLPWVERWFEGLGASLSLARYLRQLHRQYRFDVVEFPNYEGLGFVACLFRIVPAVVRLHTSTYEYIQIAGRPPRFAERFLMWLEKMSVRLANGAVTHSIAQRDKLAPVYGVRDIPVIPHAVELPATASADPACRRLAVLVVGGLNLRKGVATLFEAIPLVLAQVPDAEFWLTGGGANSTWEQKFRTEHPNIPPDRVKFLGFVAADELARLYRECAVHASASVHESFGLTLVEAMAHATPVVAGNASAMPEIVQHEKTGLLVPPHHPLAFATAMVRLLQDAGLRQTLGAAGRARAEKEYSPSRLGQQLERLLIAVKEKQP